MLTSYEELSADLPAVAARVARHIGLGEVPRARLEADGNRSSRMGSTSDMRSATTTFVSGAVAGVISRTATAPLDRLKTMQMAGGSSAVASETTAGALTVMYREGGHAALFQVREVLSCLPAKLVPCVD